MSLTTRRATPPHATRFTLSFGGSFVLKTQVEAGTGSADDGNAMIGGHERQEDTLALNSLKSLIGMSQRPRSASAATTDDDFESVVSGNTIDSDAYVDAMSAASADVSNFADFDDIDLPGSGFAADDDHAALFAKFEQVGSWMLHLRHQHARSMDCPTTIA